MSIFKMLKDYQLKFSLQILVSFLMCMLTHKAYGLQESTGLWLDAAINDRIPTLTKWHYNIEGQLRFKDLANYYELTKVYAGIEYRYKPGLNLSGGYFWSSHNPLSDSVRENGLWEEIVAEVIKKDNFVLRNRTRFEQYSRMHQPQWQSRVREKIALYFPNKITNKFVPLVSNEIFVKLNDPEWSNDKAVQENRLFIGTDFQATSTIFWQIGYLQRLQFQTTGNKLSNILYVGIRYNPLHETVEDYVD